MTPIEDFNAGLEAQVKILSAGTRFAGERPKPAERLRNRNDASREIEILLYSAIEQFPHEANALVLQLYFNQKNIAHSGFRGNLRKYIEDCVSPDKERFKMNFLLNIPFRTDATSEEERYSPIRFWTSYNIGGTQPVLELDLSVVPNLVRGQIWAEEIQKIYFARADRQKMSLLYQQDSSLGAPQGTLENYLRFGGFKQIPINAGQLQLLSANGGAGLIRDYDFWMNPDNALNLTSQKKRFLCRQYDEVLSGGIVAVPHDQNRDGVFYLFDGASITKDFWNEMLLHKAVGAAAQNGCDHHGKCVTTYGNQAIIRELHLNYIAKAQLNS